VETLFSNATVPFTASGGAVDDGVLCDAGTVTTVANLATGWQSGQTMNFHVDKEFSCPDGAFVVRLSAHLGRDGVEFRWVVIDGDGAYSGLAGSGSGVGLPLPDGSTDGVFDVYDGALIAS
jgi:TPP-dependent trihydroxycyclohexane-1,2-dione (THcHDO) dehydratase